ncbi:hypothetical protein, partial [Streptomyces tauricus]|uniref:hypothetical protein n=1 Tax=Streptomyces tauricus TaxID=68274 RepID=UPI00224460B2
MSQIESCDLGLAAGAIPEGRRRVFSPGRRARAGDDLLDNVSFGGGSRCVGMTSLAEHLVSDELWELF